jgi:hypothetical protein
LIFGAFFAHLATKFEKRAIMTLKNIFWTKSKKVLKNTEFHADFKSVGKVIKNAQEKSNQQNKFDEHE